MRDLTFYLANTPPFSGPHLDVDIGILQLQTVTELEVDILHEGHVTVLDKFRQ